MSICVTRSELPLARCISSCVIRNSDVSSRLRPNSASSFLVLDLSSVVNACMAGMPSMIVPNNLASVVELVDIRSTKSSIGMFALNAAFLNCITDLPKPAPVCDNCLNMPTLKSAVFPRSDSLTPKRLSPSNPFSASPNPSTLRSAIKKFLPVSMNPLPSALRLPSVARPIALPKLVTFWVANPMAPVFFFWAFTFFISDWKTSSLILPSFLSPSRTTSLTLAMSF